MGNTPIISVIVPIYKAENFLPKCIDSILSQTFTDFELLLIDDGSPDASGKISDDYATQNSRIRVFHKKNGGVSSARNIGLDNAKGKYIVFVDSDDQACKNYLKDLFEQLIPEKVGLIIQGINRYNSQEELLSSRKNPDLTLFSEQIHRAFYEFKIYEIGCPTTKIYNNAVLRKMKIRFDENIHMGEDLIFMLEYLNFVDYIKFSSSINYRYFIRDVESLSRKHNPFDSEYHCYLRFSAALNNLKTHFNIEEQKLVEAFGHGTSFLFRAINSLYRTKTYKPRPARISALQSLVEVDYCRINLYYKPVTLKGRCRKYLLIHRFFNLFDCWNLLSYSLRFMRTKLFGNKRASQKCG